MGTTRTPEVARRRAKKAFPSTRCVCVRKATTGASACNIQQRCFFCFQLIVQLQQPWKPTPNRANEGTQAELPRGKATSLPVLVHLPEPADEEGLAAHQQGHEREVPQLRGRTTTTPLTTTGVAQTTATPLHDGTTTGTGNRGARITRTTTWTIKRPTPTTTCKREGPDLRRGGEPEAPPDRTTTTTNTTTTEKTVNNHHPHLENLKSDRYGNPQTKKDQDNIVQDNNEHYLYYRNKRRRRRHTARRRGHTPKTAPRVRKEAAPQTRRGTHHNNQLNEKNLLSKYRMAQNHHDTTKNYWHYQQ